MGRFIIVLIILIVAGYFAYSYFIAEKSAEEQAVIDLEKQFDRASRAFAGAGRMSGATGIDMTSGAETAVKTIKRVRKELAELKSGLGEEIALARARDLQEKIETFYRANDLE